MILEEPDPSVIPQDREMPSPIQANSAGDCDAVIDQIAKLKLMFDETAEECCQKLSNNKKTDYESNKEINFKFYQRVKQEFSNASGGTVIDDTQG